MFDGAFAAVDIKEGELVEKGLMRRLPEGFDGNTCPYIFTWSTERPNKVSLTYVLCLLFVVLERAATCICKCVWMRECSLQMQRHCSSIVSSCLQRQVLQLRPVIVAQCKRKQQKKGLRLSS